MVQVQTDSPWWVRPPGVMWPLSAWMHLGALSFLALYCGDDSLCSMNGFYGGCGYQRKSLCGSFDACRRLCWWGADLHLCHVGLVAMASLGVFGPASNGCDLHFVAMVMMGVFVPASNGYDLLKEYVQPWPWLCVSMMDDYDRWDFWLFISSDIVLGFVLFYVYLSHGFLLWLLLR
ncbi:hypothetical protein SUGI_1096730 [Cryptomeria japonica]|nr:hypothetical protein SUGI_1096730 [Cryptomeria japonica]